jgi:preprotein translocase subunit SecE
MATNKDSTVNALVRDLFRADIYKRSQGRIARQVTFTSFALFVIAGVWTMNSVLASARWFSVFGERATLARYSFNALLLAAGLWICYRVVNFSRFADFLISVEVEMNKVTWPSRDELIRSSAVVLAAIFGMSAMMYFFDLFWDQLLTFLGVLGTPNAAAGP